MRSILASAICAALAVPVNAAGQEIAGDCGAFNSKGERLACIEKSLETSMATVKLKDKWLFEKRWLLMKLTPNVPDAPTYVLTTVPAVTSGDRAGSLESSALQIRCQEGVTNLAIGFGDARLFGKNGRALVTWQLDDHDPVQKRLPISDNEKGIFLWGAGRSLGFIESLFGAKSIKIRTMAKGVGVVRTSFDISGLEKVIAPLRAECDW